MKKPVTEWLSISQNDQAPVVEKLDSAIMRMNHYPADESYENQLRYLSIFRITGARAKPEPHG